MLQDKLKKSVARITGPLGSFLLQDMFLNFPAFAFEGQNKEFTASMLLTCIIYCNAGPGQMCV